MKRVVVLFRDAPESSGAFLAWASHRGFRVLDSETPRAVLLELPESDVVELKARFPEAILSDEESYPLPNGS